MGLKVTGTIGFLIRAEKLGLIESAYDKAKSLQVKEYHLNLCIMKHVLIKAMLSEEKNT
jgi:predicted nucleic acid-binding protein